nr:putative amidohydrolase [uncultured bacterium]
MNDLKILYIQSRLAWEDAETNRKHFAEIIQKEAQHHDLIVLPETFTTGFPVDPVPFAETEDGESVLWIREMAAQTGAVVTGSMLLKNDGVYTNSLIWMRPDGTYERYNKRHVFRMGGEHEKIHPGDKILLVELKGWKIRPMVCYDLRFPVWTKNHYEKDAFEYDLALFVANWPAVRAYPWDQLLIARAIENEAYVLGVNRIGKDGLGNDYNGHSKVVDAKGNVISEAPENEEAAISVKLSYEALQKFRAKFNVGQDWDSFTIQK